jgi:hypothetical protein
MQIKRINRKLAKEGFERLSVSRGERTVQSLGEYFVLDISRNVVVDFRVDLDELEAHLLGQPAVPPSSKESALFRYVALGALSSIAAPAAVDSVKNPSPKP